MHLLPTCPCGVHHERDWPSSKRRHLRRIIKRNGKNFFVTTPDGTWDVPRMWIAAHGLKAEEIPTLAAKYGWARIGSSSNGVTTV